MAAAQRTAIFWVEMSRMTRPGPGALGSGAEGWGQKPGRKSSPLPPSSVERTLCRVSPPAWVCRGVIASSRSLASFSQNAIARKYHRILQGPNSKQLMNETFPISLQPHSQKALGFKSHLRSVLSSESISLAANPTQQWR